MAIKNQTQLEAQAEVIRIETAPKANSADRIGQMYIDFIQSIYDAAATSTDITAAIDALKASVPTAGDTLNKLYLLIQGLESQVQPPVAKNYVDTAAMIADQGVLPQVQGQIYSVGTYPSLTYYEYLGTTNGDLTDYSSITVVVPVKASEADVDAGTNDERFVTPNLLRYAIAKLGQDAGGFDASGGLVPTTGTGDAGAIQKGDFWRITVAGTIIGLSPNEDLQVGDMLFAAIDGASGAGDFYAIQANVDLATATVLGLVKLYTATGSNTDGTMTQLAITNAISATTGHTIEDEATPLTNREALNFQGFLLEDDAGNDATKVTAPTRLVGAVNKDAATNYVFQGQGKYYIDSTQTNAFSYEADGTNAISGLTFSVRTGYATTWETITFANLINFLNGTYTTTTESYVVGSATNWQLRAEASFGASAPSIDFLIALNLFDIPNS